MLKYVLKRLLWVVPSLIDLDPGCRFASRCVSRVEHDLEIRRLELRDLRGGMAPEQALRRVRSRAIRDVRVRAGLMAEGALVQVAAESRILTFKDAGVLIYSANVGDDRVRDLHRGQTAATLADPLPARTERTV